MDGGCNDQLKMPDEDGRICSGIIFPSLLILPSIIEYPSLYCYKHQLKEPFPKYLGTFDASGLEI